MSGLVEREVSVVFKTPAGTLLGKLGGKVLLPEDVPMLQPGARIEMEVPFVWSTVLLTLSVIKRSDN